MIPTTARRSPVYTGTGAPASYAFAFKVFAKADIAVKVTDTGGTESTLALDTQYTVALNSDQDNFPGGTVTPVTALAAGYSLIVVGSQPYSQTTQLPNGGAYNAVIAERAMDRIVIMTQQLAEAAGRALQAPAAESSIGTLPSLVSRKGTVLGFDEVTGQPKASPFTLTQLAAVVAAIYSASAGPLDALSFLAAGAGATTRSAQAKLRESVSVLDFGAVPNDVSKAAINLVAFQAAMKALQSAGGGQLYVPPGTYTFSCASPVIVPSNVTLFGVRGASIIKPDITTLPAGADTAVFHTGNAITGAVASATGPQVVPNVGVVGTINAVSNVHAHDISIVCDYVGPQLVGKNVRGFRWAFAWDSSITGCHVYGTPNTGIVMNGGGRSRYVGNTCQECGWFGSNLSTRNGMSFTGWMDQTDATLTSRAVVVHGNESLNNYDEGIQFGMVQGMVLTGNICIGNRDRGIEGDSAYQQTITKATYAQEIPSDIIITDNYVDGAGPHQATGNWGITVNCGNEGRIHLANNIIRNVATRSAIAVTQLSGGIVVALNNTIENCTPDPNFHGLTLQAARVEAIGNRVISSSGSANQNAISLVYSLSCVAEDNTVEGGFNEAIFATCGAAAGVYAPSLLAIRNNDIMGSVQDGITASFPFATTLPLIDISGNVIAGANSSGATDRSPIRFRGAPATALSVGTVIVSGNKATYAGTTRYPIRSLDVAAGAITSMYVSDNFFGTPAMPFGKRVVETENVATNLYHDKNRVPGNLVTYGTAAPATGTWAVGDKVLLIAPAAGGAEGFICTVAGTPGTWKTFGSIAA